MPHKETINGEEGIWIKGAWYCCDHHRFYLRDEHQRLCCPWGHMRFGERRKDDTVSYCICNQNLFHHKERGEPIYELEVVEGVTDQFGNEYFFIPNWCEERQKRGISR